MTRMIALVALVITLVADSAWSFEKGALDVETADGRRIRLSVELARTPDELSQGLMQRPSLAANAGMLFDFGYPQRVTMWMKDTLISLDMLFVAADGRITAIARRTQPLSLETISAPGQVRAVLELNGGAAERLRINPGDRLDHPMFKER